MLYNSYLWKIEPRAFSDSTMFTKKGIAYSPSNKRDYQKALIQSFKILHKDFETPITGPVIAVWTFFCLRPKSIKDHINFKISRPDTDGLVKCIKDVIQQGPLSKKAKKPIMGLGVVKDDSLIFCETVQKVYISNPKQQCISLILYTNPNMSIRNFQWRICPKEILQFLVTLAD